MSNNPVRVSRRSLLNVGAKAAATLGLSNLFRPVASAASGNSACVCIYLLGGNDSNNMMVPLDSPAYDAYARGRGGLALGRNVLLPVKAPLTSSNYGFHPALAGVQDLYSRGLLAVVANVGRADETLVKGQFDPQQLPKDLFEHTGDTQIRYLPQGRLTVSWAANAGGSGPAAVPTVNPARSLSARLLDVAGQLSRTGAQSTFTITLSGFDTHADELSRQANLFAELNDGLVSFYQSLEAMGLSRSVTVFTATEFNRTLTPNSYGGSEHGWGGHNLILGGSVMGGDLFGRFPSLALGGADDLGTTGIWIPSISTEQYSATIARWYGASNLSAEFPHLGNFTQQDLGLFAG